MPQKVLNGANVSILLTDTAGTTTCTQKLAACSISTGQGTFDVSSFGSGSYVDRIGGGLKDIAGSASGFLTDGATGANPFNLIDNVGKMLVTFATGDTCTFNAIVGNVNVDISRAGVGVLRFDWSKADSADPTIAWVET